MILTEKQSTVASATKCNASNEVEAVQNGVRNSIRANGGTPVNPTIKGKVQ